ncbi:MAG: V-type ATP synthase subunit I [Actinobacteria bacterium]|nr:V-type ATP synthase subunit I [Actinomycetota bacterium]MBM3713268.1 V-type ATP synthase subunit I [Actinomycetota bacterium]
MAVANLIKLLIITHKSEEIRVLRSLQKKAIAEIKPYIPKESNIPGSPPESAIEEFKMAEQVKKILQIVDGTKDKGAKKVASKAGKLVVTKEEYEQIKERDDFQDIIEEILNYENEIKINDAEILNINSKINYLKTWKAYKGSIEDIKSTERYTIKLGLIRARKSELPKLISGFKENKLSFEIIHKDGEIYYLITAYHSSSKDDAEQYLRRISFEASELSGYKNTVGENILLLNKTLEYHKNRKANLIKLLRESCSKHERDLIIYLDFLENNFEIEKISGLKLSTEYVSFYTAWVKKTDKNKLFSELSRFKYTKVNEIQPDENEEMPIVLDNKPIFKPFELIINLYGVPRYFEIDPTPYVSLFFLIFFGLCITDAGYGIIFILFSFFIFFKMKSSRKLGLLVLLLGIFTLFAGALFNGWFGDIPSYLGFEKFFSRIALLGDPMKSDAGAMNFFRLALLLGVIQVVFGLFIRFFDNIRKKDYQAAFLDTLPWIIIVISLVIMLLSTNMAVSMQLVAAPIFPAWISKILIWLLIPAAAVVILFSARSQKSWGFRIFMGFLNLTIVNGITSFMGDFLSYIRLMALGLVTAGIGVAINKIAFGLTGIPVIGIVILIVGLIFGHIFNMGINILGGFVHTLRLQYVEFFSKFYEGGGRSFETFKEEHKYIIIVG